MDSTFDYMAWVPCLSGKLFLSHVSVELGSSKIISEVNHLETSETGDTYTRYVVVSSEVDWKDTPSHCLDGDFKVTLIGASEGPDGCLHGIIYIRAKEVADDDNWIKIESALADLRRKAKPNSNECLSQDFWHVHSLLQSYDSDLFFRVDFSLSRRGLVLLTYHPTKESESDLEHIATAVRQAFYYLKYSIHKHEHHHYDDDSLTTVHPVPDDFSSMGLVLIDDIKRSLVKLKRTVDSLRFPMVFHGQGMVSYARSLLQTCKGFGIINDKDYDTELSFFNNIESSLSTTGRRIQRDLSTKIAASDYARSMILFVIAVMGPLVIVFREAIVDTIPNNSLIKKVVLSIFSSDLNIIFIGVFLFLSYWVQHLIRYRFGTYFLAFRWFRYVLELIVHDPYKASILSLILVGIGFFIIVVAFVQKFII